MILSAAAALFLSTGLLLDWLLFKADTQSRIICGAQRPSPASADIS
jgi:hypothetical protein